MPMILATGQQNWGQMQNDVNSDYIFFWILDNINVTNY